MLMLVTVMVSTLMITMMMNVRGKRRNLQEYGRARRIIRNRPVNVRGAHVHRYPL